MIENAERVLFVHAHPDDETLWTGATIATLIDRGAEVTVLTCTRGERGEVIPAALKRLQGSPELAAHRETELSAALAALGVTDHRYLGEADARWEGREPRRYLDSGMRWGKHGAEALDTTDPSSLVAADIGEVAADIAAVMIRASPHVVVSYDADGGYGHPDHVRAHEATRRAAEVIGVPFYVIERSPSRGTGLSVDPMPVLERKRAALAAHRTQVTVTGDDFWLSSGDPRPIATVEHFRRVRPKQPSFGDYSLVTRIAACVMAVVLGALVGGLLTVIHQAGTVVGGVRVPWGIIVAVVLTAALLTGLRMVFETRIVPGLAAAGLLGASAFLALQSAGGSVLVPGNTVGYIWTFAPALIAMVVLAWPRFTRPGDGKIGRVPAAKGPDLL